MPAAEGVCKRVVGLTKLAGCARRESVVKVGLQLKLAYSERFKIYLVELYFALGMTILQSGECDTARADLLSLLLGIERSI